MLSLFSNLTHFQFKVPVFRFAVHTPSSNSFRIIIFSSCSLALQNRLIRWRIVSYYRQRPPQLKIHWLTGLSRITFINKWSNNFNFFVFSNEASDASHPYLGSSSHNKIFNINVFQIWFLFCTFFRHRNFLWQRVGAIIWINYRTVGYVQMCVFFLNI